MSECYLHALRHRSKVLYRDLKSPFVYSEVSQDDMAGSSVINVLARATHLGLRLLALLVSTRFKSKSEGASQKGIFRCCHCPSTRWNCKHNFRRTFASIKKLFGGGYSYILYILHSSAHPQISTCYARGPACHQSSQMYRLSITAHWSFPQSASSSKNVLFKRLPLSTVTPIPLIHPRPKSTAPFSFLCGGKMLTPTKIVFIGIPTLPSSKYSAPYSSKWPQVSKPLTLRLRLSTRKRSVSTFKMPLLKSATMSSHLHPYKHGTVSKPCVYRPI